MTKEEVLLKTRGLSYFEDTMGFHNAMFEAMDEYAKQQAVAFDEWKADNKWAQSMHNNYFFKEHTTQYKTSRDLYNLFIERQTNENG